ncbi:glycosyltransferase family protein [Hoylesella buccalis]|uniref:glycosyltransferase family protein n=1 Tax=Hoylesella buccalis TaxID=28127 RepID=UPI0012E01A46
MDDQKFLYYLANCKAYATTGGFESVCEAMYMGKPAMMIPVHVEQECNAHEAMLEGAGST